MAELVRRVEVDAPVERTWAAVVDWPAQGDWMPGTRVRATAQGGVGVGGGIEAVTGVGPLAVTDTMEITRWDPPHRCEVRHTGRAIRGSGAFEVLPLPDGRSVFVWSEWLDLPLGLLGQLGWLAVRPLFGAGVARALTALARSVEAGAAAERA